MTILKSLINKLDDSVELLSEPQKDMYDYENQYDARCLIEDIMEDLQKLSFFDKIKILFNI